AVLDLKVRIGTVDLTGDFYFDQSVQPDGTKVTRFAVAEAAITVSGNGIKNAEGAFVVKTGGFAGTLSGDLAVATGGASVSGRAGFRINTFTTAVNETITVAGRPIAVVFSASEVKVGANSFFGFFAENLALNIGNFVTIEGTVSFVNSGGRSTFAGANLLVFMGQGPARLPSGELNPAATGVLISNARVGLIRVGTGYALNATGTIEVIGINGVTIAGQATVLVNTTGLAISETLFFPGDNGDPGVTLNFPTIATVTRFEALNAELSFAGQTLKGDFAFAKVTSGAAGDLRIAATHVSLDLGDDTTTFLKVTDGQGALLLTPAGAAGSLAATVEASIPGASLVGRFSLAVNSTSAPVSESFMVGTESVSLDVPAGPFIRVDVNEIDATHPATLTIGGQSLSGEYFFERSLSTLDGTPIIRGAATGVKLDLVAGTTPIATVRNGEGAFVITSAGVAGRVSGTVTITPPGGTFSGDFSLALNSSATAIDESFAVGASTVRVTLPAGPFVRVEAVNARLDFQGQSIRGDFAFERATTATGVVVRVALTNGSAQFADGSVRITNVRGSFLSTATALAGDLSASVAITAPSVALSGDFRVQLNTGALPVTSSFTVGTEAITLDVTGGPYLRFEGVNLALDVAGQTLRGDFSLENVTLANGTRVVRIAAANVVLALGGPPAIVTVTGSGQFLITTAGVAGEVDATVATAISGVTFGGAFKIRVNNTAAAVSETFKVAGVTKTLSLPAGPYIRVEGTTVTLTVLGQTLMGDFVIEQATGTDGRRVTRVALQKAELGLGGTAPNNLLKVTNGAGFIILNADGLAGRFSGSVALTVPGVQFSGGFTVEINNTFAAVDEAIEIGGGVQTLILPAGPFLRVTGDDLVLTAAGQKLRGSFAFQQVTRGAEQVITVGVRGVSLALGDGANTFVKVTNGEGALLITSTGLAGQVSGFVSITIPNVSINRTMTIAVNTTGIAVNETIDVAGVPVALKLDAGNFVRVEATNLEAVILGQRLNGDFSIERILTTGPTPSAVVRIALGNVSLALGDGTTDYVTITNGTGAFVIKQAGLAGDVSGTVGINVPNVAFSAGLKLQINTTGAAVNETFTLAGQPKTLSLPAGNYVQLATLAGAPATLTVLGLEISANFTIRKETTGTGAAAVTRVAVAITGLSLQIKDGATTFVNVTGGSGALLFTPAGVAAQFTVTAFTAGAPGVFTLALLAGGELKIAVNTSAQPVKETFTTGGGSVTIDVPAGPFARVEVTKASVVIGTETTSALSGDFFFDQLTRADGTKVTRVAAANVEVSITTGTNTQTLKNGEGAFVILPTGFAGYLSGELKAGAGGVEIGGSLGMRVNKTGVAVDEAIELGGRTFRVQFPDGANVFSFFAAGLTIKVGDFIEIEGESIAFTAGAAGDTLIASGVSIFMGDGPSKLNATTRNPAAQGVLLSNARVGVLRIPVGNTFTYAVYAEGTIEVIGFSGFAFTGSAKVRFNNVGSDKTISFPRTDGTNDSITIADTARSFEGNLALSVSGLSLSGTFAFEQSLVAGVKVTKVGITNAAVSIGDGSTEFVSVTEGTGGFVIKPTGIAGSFAAKIAVNPALGFSFSAGLSVQVNTTAAKVTDSVPDGAGGTLPLDLPAGPYFRLAGTGVTLTVSGVDVKGDFAVERYTKA
ncbi:MAG: hypothetical protein WCF18_00050, partial [Chthoniobacteraceae bacterium]